MQKLKVEVEQEEIELKKSMSPEEYEEFSAKRMVESLNTIEGDLEYYNCPKCLNRGYINHYEIQNGKARYYVVDCECRKIRKIFRNLEMCGVNKEMLSRCTFENFKCSEEWQSKMKAKFEKYLNEIKNGNSKKWLAISGVSGCGKTMLCTATFQKLIQNGMNGKYMMWLDSIPQLKALKKSSYTDNQEKYEKIMNELKTIDVLYIDDMFKQIDNYSKSEDLNIAYEIINARYNNDLITIISTEMKKLEVEQIDLAIFGRIFQKCNGNWIELKYDNARNYRLKNNENEF